MADLVITSNTVEDAAQGTGSSFESGAIITPGDWCFLDTAADNVAKLAVTTAQLTAVVKGMALNEVSKIGQPVALALTGATVNFTSVAALAGVGFVYILSEAGLMAPIADLAGTDYLTILGWSITATQFHISIENTGLLNT